MAIEERQYQQDAIESLRQGFRVGHRRQVLSASTGAGKSVIMLQMIKAAQDKGSKIVFICERRVLVEQFSRHLDAAGIDHGVLMAKHWRFRPDAQVQVATAQTLERMETWPAFDICFVDEIHACFVAGTLVDGKPIETLCVGDLVTSMNHETGLVEIKPVTEIFKHLTLETVTVKTDDGSAVTCTKSHPIYTQDGYVDAVELSNDSVLQSLKFIEPQGEDHVACKRPGRAQGFFTEPTRVVSVTLQEPGSDAVGSTDFTALQSIEVFNLEVEGNHNYFANGLLVHNCLRTSLKRLFNNRPDLRVIGATATPFHPEMGHYFSAVTSVITMKELVDKGYLVPYRVFIAHEIDTAGVKVVAGEWQKDELEKRGQQIVGDVVADYIRISNEVWGEQRKTICFSCGIAHGAELVRKFVEAGINAVQISSNDEDEYRAEVLADFAKPDTDIKVIVSVAILSRGFDQPDVHHVILARPLKKSFSEHVQQMGRVARPYPGKAFAIVQDHSGNYLRFQASFDKLYNEGVKTLDGEEDKKSREEPTPKEKEASKCPACGHLWGGADVCPHCGHVRTRRNDVVSIAGVMKEITVSNAKPQVDQIDWYAQAIGYAEEHGKKPGFAYYKFKEKFKTDPPAIKPAPKYPTPAVANWFRSRAIAYAKGMAKGRMQ